MGTNFMTRIPHYASAEVKAEQTEIFGIHTENSHEENADFIVKSADETSTKPEEQQATHKCDVCAKDFKKRCYMLRHKKRHTDERKYKCDVCSMPFTTRIYRTKHMKTHTGDRNYQCELCPLTFKMRPTLMKHMLTHTTERNHKCDICAKIFKTKKCLQSHVQIHNEREHQCEICRKSFSTRRYLAVHLQVHAEGSKYRCGVCDKVFKIRGCLWQHMKIHSDEGSHKCEVCSKVYNTREHMLQHMKRHGNKKKFEGNHSCKVCSRRFKSMRAVSAHMKSHSKKAFAWKLSCNLKIGGNEESKQTVMENLHDEQDTTETNVHPIHEQVKTEPIEHSDLLCESKPVNNCVVGMKMEQVETVDVKREISNTNCEDFAVNPNRASKGTFWNIDAKTEVDEVGESYKNRCFTTVFTDN